MYGTGHRPAARVGVSAPAVSAAVGTDGNDRTDRPGRGERLLVVEDEVDIADLLRAGLRFLGFDVRVAHTGREALTVAEEFRPHLMLMDVMLPDINGYELCRQIRNDRETVGVVFLTARNRTEDAIAGLTVGGDDYISKPFSLDEVVARVRAVLRRLEPLWAQAADSEARRGRDGVLRFVGSQVGLVHV
ncbi:MAG: response regulator, partial [Actinobacteria bacterium]|nr:response regulator [Actinomycetota bacterium]